MQAIILAGGMGTRLRSILQNIPKPMAPIHNKPFLAYLLDYLQSQGIAHVVLSVHYLREQIQDFFKNEYAGIQISYAIEEEPLGTGGAILKSLEKINLDQPVFVLNGDTFLKLNYRKMFHECFEENLSMALRKMPDCSRYGAVVLNENHIVAFTEKGIASAGWINGGVYLINPRMLQQEMLPQKFSFETDFLFPSISKLKPRAFLVDDYFIDIGIPEDYAQAERDFS